VIRPGGLALTERALGLCNLPPSAAILDVGCGPAATVERLNNVHGLHAFGLDLSSVLLRSGRNRSATLPLIEARGEWLPIANHSLDAVLAECSLSLMDGVERMLAEFKRVLRIGGHLVISDIYARNPDGLAALRRLSIEPCLRGALPQAEIVDRVQAYGFQIGLWEDHSDALRSFAARLIWSNGSLARFWHCAASGQIDPQATRHAIVQARPGYYLLIAQATTD
jgi:ubiquinone/menaquinone biosynthesis C-methylase UbiE